MYIHQYGWHYYYPSFTDEETEAQGDKPTCLRFIAGWVLAELRHTEVTHFPEWLQYMLLYRYYIFWYSVRCGKVDSNLLAFIKILQEYSPLWVAPKHATSHILVSLCDDFLEVEFSSQRVCTF